MLGPCKHLNSTGSLQNYRPSACPLKEVADDNYECSLPGLMCYLLCSFMCYLCIFILSQHVKKLEKPLSEGWTPLAMATTLVIGDQHCAEKLQL